MNNIKTSDETYIAAKAILEGQMTEASGEFPFAAGNTPWTKKGPHNYDAFLSANEDRIGKPMIDGGLKSTDKNAESVNGQPNEDIIYCGAGCVAYMRGDTKVFIKLPSGLINGSDGTVPWSTNKSYDSEGVIVKGKTSAEFKAYVAALTVAEKA
jgi:hypothetical protein